MAISNNTYTGNGSNRLFTITFPYLETTDVKVYVNNTLTTAYTFANATTIEFTVAPANGAQILIQRETFNEASIATFFPGSSVRAADLNDNFDQALYIRQEILDTTWDTNAQTTYSTETWTSVDTQVATNQAVDQRIDFKIDTALTSDVFGSDGVSITDNSPGSGQITVGLSAGSVDLDRIKDADIITTAEQDAGTPSWVSDDTKIPTIGAAAKRFDTIVQTGTPVASNYQSGKTWLQNDTNKTLSIWDGSAWVGVASGGTFTSQPTVIYVDNVNGNDANDGHRIINPKKTIKNAVASAAAGDTIKVAPGVYQEVLPIDITVANLSIVGEAQRSCFVHPTPATETQIMFRCNSGTYIDGFTFAGLKASGTPFGNAIDGGAPYGLPTNQGWVAGFLPGCVIRKSPYINNCTNFADSGIDNNDFNPNSTTNFSSNGGDTDSAPTGGGVIVDGSLPSTSSPLRSFVLNEFTQVCLDGPGLLVCNNGYAQAVSFFGLFCHYHVKALSGGQINMEVGTTDFGRYGLIADGKSTTPIFTATSNGSAAAAAVTFAINAPTTGSGWFGDVNRPAINMLAEVTVSGTTYLYPILNSGVNGSGWNVTISRPNPSDKSENLGLNVTVPSGTQWRFYLRSMVSTASHTMEYAGSGTDYTALPENGGVPIEANESINRNGGKVWLTSTDQSGKFKVGDTFAVDQQTGFVTIDPQSISTNVVSDLTPELGGDLDVLARNIYSSVGNVVINDPLEILSGTAASPSLTFTGDLNTGIYSPGADQAAISTGGVQRATVDATGRLLVGTSNARSNLVDLSPQLQIEGSDQNTSSLSITRNSSTSTGPALLLAKSRGTTAGAVTIVQNNDLLGGVYFMGADSTNMEIGAQITGEVDGTPGNNDLPSRLVFSTTADGASSPTERMRLDSSGRLFLGTNTAQLLVGTSTSTNNTRLGEKLAVVSNGGSAGNNGGISLTNYAGSGDPGLAPVFDFQRSRGTTDGSFTEVASGDALGYIVFRGADGAGWSDGAWIKSEADGDWTTSGDTTDSPGRLVFSTTADGAASPTERMRITSNGTLVLSGPGIQFPTGNSTAISPAAATSNTLSDYEEGTFTPTVIGSTTAGAATYTDRTGHYTKVGRLVTVSIFLGWTSGTGTGFLQVTGLPFSVNASIYSAVSIGYIENIALTASNYIIGVANQGTSGININQTPTGGGAATGVPYDIAGVLVMTCSYFV
jgi:hypothetical protein